MPHRLHFNLSLKGHEPYGCTIVCNVLLLHYHRGSVFSKSTVVDMAINYWLWDMCLCLHTAHCHLLFLLTAGPWCGSQRDEQRDSRGDRDLPSVQQPATALSLHQSQLTAETQGKNTVKLRQVILLNSYNVTKKCARKKNVFVLITILKCEDQLSVT